MFTRARSKGVPTLPPLPDAISNGPNLSRRFCLCARSGGCLLCPSSQTKALDLTASGIRPEAGADTARALPCSEMFAHTALKRGSELPNQEDHALSLRNSSRAKPV